MSSSSGYWDNVQQRLLLAFPQVTELLLCDGAQAKVGLGILQALLATTAQHVPDVFGVLQTTT